MPSAGFFILLFLPGAIVALLTFFVMRLRRSKKPPRGFPVLPPRRKD